MNHELHAAAFVEESLGDNRVLGRHRPENGTAGDDVIDDLFGAGSIDAAFRDQPINRVRGFCGIFGNRSWKSVRCAFADLLSQRGDVMGEFTRASRRFTAPEGDGRRRAVCVLDKHTTRAGHAPNSPRCIAEQHDVAGETLDRKILVDRPDDGSLRFGDDRIQPVFGNRAAARDRGQARVATAAQSSVDAIAKQVRAVSSATCSDALREHFENLVKVGARKIRVRRGLRDELEQIVLLPFVCRTHRDNLLRENIERRFRNDNAIEIALANGTDERGHLYQLVSRRREQPSFRNRSAPVSRTADALHSNCDRPRRSDLTNEIDVPDVDAELERCGRDQRANFTDFQPALRLEPDFS